MFDFTGGLGTLAAGALGLLASGDSKKTESSAPWEPVQPYLLQGLKDTDTLNKYYQKNPFSQLQQKYYTNQFNDIDNFRNSVAPQLMAFANQGMTGGYQRGGSVLPHGNAFSTGASWSGNSGGSTNVPTYQFGSVFNQTPTTTQQSQPVGNYYSTSTFTPGNAGTNRDGGLAGNGTNFTDAQWSSIKDMRDVYGGVFNNPVDQISLSALVSSMSPTLAGLLGYPAGDPMTAQERSIDSIRNFEGGNGINSSVHDGFNVGPSENSRASRDAADNNKSQTDSSSSSSESGGGSSSGEYKGGLIDHKHQEGPDPKGPDNGYTKTQRGEYVIKKDAVKKYGKGLLDEINSKRFTKQQGK